MANINIIDSGDCELLANPDSLLLKIVHCSQGHQVVTETDCSRQVAAFMQLFRGLVSICFQPVFRENDISLFSRKPVARQAFLVPVIPIQKGRKGLVSADKADLGMPIPAEQVYYLHDSAFGINTDIIKSIFPVLVCQMVGHLAEHKREMRLF